MEEGRQVVDTQHLHHRSQVKIEGGVLIDFRNRVLEILALESALVFRHIVNVAAELIEAEVDGNDIRLIRIAIERDGLHVVDGIDAFTVVALIFKELPLLCQVLIQVKIAQIVARHALSLGINLDGLGGTGPELQLELLPTLELVRNRHVELGVPVVDIVLQRTVLPLVVILVHLITLSVQDGLTVIVDQRLLIVIGNSRQSQGWLPV